MDVVEQKILAGRRPETSERRKHVIERVRCSVAGGSRSRDIQLDKLIRRRCERWRCLLLPGLDRRDDPARGWHELSIRRPAARELALQRVDVQLPAAQLNRASRARDGLQDRSKSVSVRR